MNVHLICLNDDVKLAVIEDEEKAKERMDELKKSYFDRRCKSYTKNEDEYNKIFHWHIYTVPGC